LNSRLLIFLILLIFSVFTFAIDIPFSETPLHSEKNRISNFFCSIPPDSSNIPLETECWIWYDNENIFFSWEAEINDNLIVGKYSPEDVTAQSDQICIQIITDQINNYSYGFIAYPLGNRSDFVRSTTHVIDYDWNSTYDYSSSIKESKWIIEMKIPFKDLRFNGKPPFNWKLVLSRYIKMDDKKYTAPFLTTQMGKDYFRDAIDISINTELRRSRNFYLRPFSIVKTDLLENETKFDHENFGFDLSFKPNSSSQLKATFNPDFSDVPIDDEINNFNSKYASFYSENRYFFIKDLNALGANSTLFYSRQIAQPEFALKYTGKTKNLTFGILSTKAKQVVKQIGTQYFIVDSDDVYNILALKPSKDNFNLQVTLINRMNKDYHNEVLHLNPNWEFRKDQNLWLDFNLSNRDSISIDKKKGYFGTAGYDYRDSEFSFSISATQMSKNYCVDMGKIYEDDFYGWNFNSSLYKEFKSNQLRSVTSSIDVSEEIDNHTSKLLERYAHFDLSLNSNYYLDFELDCVLVKEFYSDKYFSKHQVSLQTTWKKPKLFRLFAGINFVNYIIYALDNDYQGQYLQLGLSGIVNKYISYTITADKMIYYDVPDVSFVDDKYWFANFDISFSPSNTLDLTSGIRYNNYEYYDYSQHIGIFSNLRWQFRKQSYIYLGYNSANNKINDIDEYSSQQAYLKISYSF